MSADNWGVCPKCLKQQEIARQKEIAKVNNQYGKIPAHEWKALDEKANKPLKQDQTLREDYDIRIDKSGVFSIEYSGSCDQCGFKYRYEYKKEMDI